MRALRIRAWLRRIGFLVAGLCLLAAALLVGAGFFAADDKGHGQELMVLGGAWAVGAVCAFLVTMIISWIAGLFASRDAPG
jgi:hypothetical protein